MVFLGVKKKGSSKNKVKPYTVANGWMFSIGEMKPNFKLDRNVAKLIEEIERFYLFRQFQSFFIKVCSDYLINVCVLLLFKTFKSYGR